MSNLSVSLSMVFDLIEAVLSFCSHFLSLHNIELNSAMMIMNATNSNRFGKTNLLVSMLLTLWEKNMGAAE